MKRVIKITVITLLLGLSYASYGCDEGSSTDASHSTHATLILQSSDGHSLHLPQYLVHTCQPLGTTD